MVNLFIIMSPLLRHLYFQILEKLVFEVKQINMKRKKQPFPKNWWRIYGEFIYNYVTITVLLIFSIFGKLVFEVKQINSKRKKQPFPKNWWRTMVSLFIIMSPLPRYLSFRYSES